MPDVIDVHVALGLAAAAVPVLIAVSVVAVEVVEEAKEVVVVVVVDSDLVVCPPLFSSVWTFTFCRRASMSPRPHPFRQSIDCGRAPTAENNALAEAFVSRLSTLH